MKWKIKCTSSCVVGIYDSQGLHDLRPGEEAIVDKKPTCLAGLEIVEEIDDGIADMGISEENVPKKAEKKKSKNKTGGNIDGSYS